MPSCFTCVLLCDPLDCSPAGSSVPEIIQARILEWVVISTFRDQTCISCISCIDRQILYQLHHLGSWLFLSETCILKLMHVIDKDQSRIFSVPVTSSHSVPTPPCSGTSVPGLSLGGRAAPFPCKSQGPGRKSLTQGNSNGSSHGNHQGGKQEEKTQS